MEDFMISFISMVITGTFYHKIQGAKPRILYCAIMIAALTYLNISFRWLMITVVFLLFEEMRREARPVYRKKKSALLALGILVTALSYLSF